MQIAKINSGTTVEIGITEKTNFRIEADGKMFRLLSDTLYQNKIGSMVREVSCNAVDAHIAADKADVPFVIHAPCQLEPWFSVIDTGVGLSHEEVCDIFTCFGKSTKSNSNTMVGAFGFGSKTPFAYTNAFTVISVQDGKRNCYAAVIGEDNLPSMNLLDTQETDAPNGVEVTVSVEPSDFREFYREIAEQLRFFKVKPIIKGSSSVQFEDPLATAVETINDKTVFRTEGDVEAVQGGVAYPIDLSQLKKGLDKRTNASVLSEFIDNVVYNYHPAMFFDIGQIAVTPSRESISYDVPTVQNILDRLDEVRVALTAKIESQMDAMATVWERTLCMRENRHFYSKLFKLNANKWGIPADNADVYIRMPDEIDEAIDHGDKRVRHTMHRFYRNTSAQNFRMSAETWLSRKLHPTAKSVIVIDDGAGAANSRIRRYIEENRDSQVYFFGVEEAPEMARWTKKDADDNEVEHVNYGNYVQGEYDPIVFAKVLAAIDGAPIVMLSDWPKPERTQIVRLSDGTEVAKERPKYTPAKAYKFVGTSYSHFDEFKHYEKTFVAPKKMTEPAAYVSVERRTITLPGTVAYQDTQLIMAAKASGDFTMEVYALREKDIEKIKDNPLWKPLDVVATELRPALVEKYKGTFVRYALRSSGGSYGQILNGGMTEYLQQNVDRLHDPLLKGMLARQNRYNKRNRKSVRLSNICSHLFNDQINVIHARVNAKDCKRRAALNKRYACFGMNSYGFNSPDLFDDYLDLLNIRYKKHLASKVKS